MEKSIGSNALGFPKSLPKDGVIPESQREHRENCPPWWLCQRGQFGITGSKISSNWEGRLHLKI